MATVALNVRCAPGRNCGRRRLCCYCSLRNKVLLRSIVQDAATEGVDDVKGAWEVEGVIEERAPEGVAIMDGAIGAERGVKEVFVFIIW
jgi:hypothetical protein